MIQYTEEQNQIREAIRNTSRDMMVKAYAGTSKTTTILASITDAGVILPQFSNSLLLAFAKANEQDFRKKLDLPLSGVTQPMIKTINALGFGFLKTVTGQYPKTNAYKLQDILSANQAAWGVTDDEYQDVIEEVQLAMVRGLVPQHAFAKRRIEMADNESMSPTALLLLKASIKMAFQGLCSFDDQIYIPTFFAPEAQLRALLPSMNINTVFVDEAQDFSATNIEFLKQLAPKRLIVVGDPNQSVYGFRGAREGAMEMLLRGRDYDRFQLSKSFRVPHTLSARYAHFAHGFHSHESCAQGTFTILEKWNSNNIEDGAAILCRNNAPLISLCFRLIRDGRSATILGRNIGITLANRLKKICPKVVSVDRIVEWRESELLKYPKRIDTINDTAECLTAFIQAFAPETDSEKAQNFLRQLFSDGAKISLATGHKSKGLEWENVYHLDPWRIAFKTDPKDEFAMKQEENLRYVIETRAKKKLTIINLNQMEKLQ